MYTSLCFAIGMAYDRAILGVADQTLCLCHSTNVRSFCIYLNYLGKNVQTQDFSELLKFYSTTL